MKSIKQYWDEWMQSIAESNDQAFKDTIASLGEQLAAKELNEAELLAELKSINKKYLELELVNDIQYKQTVDLFKQIEKLSLTTVEKQLNNKYPKGNIAYRGRPLPFGKKNVEFPINILITPNDFNIIKDLKRWKLYQTEENPETLIPKIYKKIKEKYYKYESDKKTWGINELWEFVFESMAKLKIKKGVDCDSWSHFQMSYYIAAGLKDAFGRIVVGNCSFGGHSTIYIYSLEDKKWHHLNSTYGPFSNFKRVNYFPTHEMARNGKDKIGITKVWFSFNRLYSWYKFGKDIPKDMTVIK